MIKLNINTSTKYDVLIGENLLESSGKLILDVKKSCKAAIISDDLVYSLYGETVKKSLESEGFKTCLFTFENGEKSKNFTTYGKILEFLAESKITRTDIVVALGGGVVGDMAGFCAATYLRGIDFVQIPTTLLAAVDSSVGGKTAIDLRCGKNLVGAFHQPSLVICDTKTFETLDERQVSCGMAEVIKYALMCDKELFDELEASLPDYTHICEKCVNIKREIVEKDEFERGDRKLLNLGHTLGHAVEVHSEFSLTHGESVAVGMMMIAKISEAQGFAKENITNRLEKVLVKYGLPTKYSILSEELFNIATGDKKVSGESITIVLPEYIGSCKLIKMPLNDFQKILPLAF